MARQTSASRRGIVFMIGFAWIGCGDSGAEPVEGTSVSDGGLVPVDAEACRRPEACEASRPDGGVSPMPRPTNAVCGDGVCSATESCGTCAQDCGGCPVPGQPVDLAMSHCFRGRSVDRSFLGPDPAEFSADSLVTYDMRGERYVEDTEGGSTAVIEPRSANDVCLVGPTVVGPLDESFSWLSGHKPDGIQHSRATGRYEVHGAWLELVNDALSPPKSPDTDRNAYFVYRDIYARNIRDDLLENDACLGGEIHDSLFDGVHMGFSARPGGSVDVVDVGPELPVVRVENTMIRLVCQRDDRSDSSCGGNTSHGHFFKLSSRCRTNGDVDNGESGPFWVLRNVIFRADDVSRGGIDSMGMPPEGRASYENVTIIYLGPRLEDFPAVPNGVTLITDPGEGESVWSAARDQWLDAHGCDAAGNNCQYLQR